MNPLKQDDPRHARAVEAGRGAGWYWPPSVPGESRQRQFDFVRALDGYHAALKAQGVVLVEAYAGDDAGRT